MSTIIKKGDWKCHCGSVNFATRDKCYKCADLKSKSIKKPGDWDCPNCKELNFASRNQCRKCNTVKPLIVNNIRRMGDWQCQSCKSDKWNFSSRTNCLTCGASRSSNECKICLEQEIEVAFKECGHAVSCESCCYKMDKCPICR